MSDLVIGSNRNSDRLVIWTVTPRDRWQARIDFGDLTAEATVCERYSREELKLDDYFGQLAADWRAWRGVREWESLGLRLAASHDGLGHITLEATLDQDYASADRWRVRASLLVDAGSLEPLSRAARVLDET